MHPGNWERSHYSYNDISLRDNHYASVLCYLSYCVTYGLLNFQKTTPLRVYSTSTSEQLMRSSLPIYFYILYCVTAHAFSYRLYALTYCIQYTYLYVPDPPYASSTSLTAVRLLSPYFLSSCAYVMNIPMSFTHIKPPTVRNVLSILYLPYRNILSIHTY
jgi:hypothetical protein